MKKTIKNILKRLFHDILKLAYFIWPYKRTICFKKNKTKIYSGWIKNEFKAFGNGTSIHYPMNLHGGKHITIGSNVGIGKAAILSAYDSYKGYIYTPIITIGDYTSIGEDSHITAINKICIGHNVLIGKKVTITDNGHGSTTLDMFNMAPIKRPLYSKGPVIIEDSVWIGDKATILPGVTIGKNAIVGANSLVTKNVPPNCVVGGVPAKLIKRIE